MHLPDPRFERPELLYPGRKPTGPVVVAAEHSVVEDAYGRGWSNYVLCDNSQPYELITKSFCASSNSGLRVTAGGVGVDFNDANNDSITLPIDVNSDNSFSAVVVGVFDDNGSQTLISTRDALSSGMQFRFSSGLIELIRQNHSVVSQPSHAPVSVGEVFAAGVTYNYDKSYALYLNGVKLDSGVAADSLIVDNLFIGYRNGEPAEAWDGVCLTVMAVNGVRSVVEMVAATSDPYQFLIPQ